MQLTPLLRTMYKVFIFALPLSASGVINMVSSFICMMMVAQLGKIYLAAAAIAIITYIAFLTVASTILFAVGILISHHRGQLKSSAEVGTVVKNGFWIALVLIIPSGLGLWNIDKVLLFFGQETKLVLLSRGYFHYAALNMIPLLFYTVIGQFYAGIGKPRFTMWMALLALLPTILLSYGFILGHFGLPVMGLAGITCASFIAQSCMVIIILFMMYFNKSLADYAVFKAPFLPTKEVCLTILNLGMPIGMQFGGEIAAMTVATYMMGYFGISALAASQLVSQYSMFIVMLSMGLTQAISLLMSEAYGKKDHVLLKEYFYASISLVFIINSFLLILFLGYPTTLIKFYLHTSALDPAFLHLCIIFFAIGSVFMLVDSLRHLFSGVLRGLHDSQAPMRIGIISLWFVSLPICYVLGFTFHGGPVALRIGFVSGFVFAVVWLWFRIRKKFRGLLALT